MRFKTLRGNPKRTISVSDGLELLQMTSELDTGQCVSEDVGPQRKWIVRSHIGWRGKRNISYKGVETSPLQTRFKTLRENPKGKTRSTDGGHGRLIFSSAKTSELAVLYCLCFFTYMVA